jgi:hypothetical protein
MIHSGIDAGIADRENFAFQQAEEEQDSGPIFRMKDFFRNERLGRSLGNPMFDQIVSGQKSFQKRETVCDHDAQADGTDCHNADLRGAESVPGIAHQMENGDADQHDGCQERTTPPCGFFIPVAFIDHVWYDFA